MKFIKIVTLLFLLLNLNVNAFEKKVRWKLAMSWNSTLSPLIYPPKRVAQIVKLMSDGKFTIRIDAANKHKAPFEILDMVKAGRYDMGHSASYYWKGKDINLLPFTTMPFGMTTSERYSWFYYGGGFKLMQKAYKKHKVLSFLGGNLGNQMGGWFRKEIKTIKDLKKLKMRIAGFAGEIMADIGVTVVNLAPAELYTSLERNVIDAVEWVGPSMDIKMGFQKIAPYYYTGWQEPGGELQFLVNKKSYNKLSIKNQKILNIAIKLAGHEMYVKLYHMSINSWQKIAKDYPNVKIKTFSKEIMDTLKATNKKLIDKMKQKSGKNGLLTRILNSQEAYMKKARKWTVISKYTYLKDNL